MKRSVINPVTRSNDRVVQNPRVQGFAPMRARGFDSRQPPQSAVVIVWWSAMRFVYVSLATALTAILLLSPTAWAAETANAVPKICDAYIRSQASFKKIPTSFCRRHDWQGLCFKHHVDGVEETFGIRTMGTCATDNISILQGTELTAEEIEAEDSLSNKFTCKPYYAFTPRGEFSAAQICTTNHAAYASPKPPSPIQLWHLNAEGDGDFMGSRITPLDYHGVLILKYGVYLSKPSRKGIEALCELRKSYVGLDKAEPATNDICKKLARNEFTDLKKPLDEATKQQWASHEYDLSGNSMIAIGLIEANLRHTGKMDHIISYSYTSSAGCTCEATQLALFNREPLEKKTTANSQAENMSPDDAKLSAALGELMISGEREDRCWNPQWSIIRIDGADYVLREREGRDLYSYSNGGFSRICHQAGKYETTAKPYGRPGHSRHNHQK